MAISLVVSSEPLADRPRVRLDVTATNVAPNAVGPNALVDLYRTHADGSRHQVIVEAGSRLSGGAGVWYDYHAPFAEQITYSVVIGTVEASAVDAAGYWNYAPAPNLLPSRIAGLGRAGDPIGNGWIVSLGYLTVAGNYLKIAGMGPGIADTETGTFPIPASLAGASPYTVQMKIKNSSAGTYSPTIAITWLDGTGAALATHSIETGHTWAANNEQTFTMSNLVPSGATRYGFLLYASFATLAGSALIEGFMIETGSSPSAIPAPEWVPATSAQAVLASDVTWLISPTSPSLSCPVEAVRDLSSRNRPTQSGMLSVIGRRNPIAISGGRRAGSRGTIVVRSDSGPLDDAIEALLDTDGPILINPQAGFGRDLPWIWVQPGDLEVRNPGEFTGYPYRHFAIPYTEVDQPEVYSGSLWTCQNVSDTYATCADVVTVYATALDLQTDTRAA